MFRKTPICLLLTFMMGAAAISAQAQSKYGHMNLGNMLESMPDTKKANSQLKVFADSLGVKDSLMTKAFQDDVAKYQTDYQAGKLTPVQAQQIESELQQKQEAIQKFEQQAQQLVAAKREELLKPILQKVEDAVKSVASENGYLMIFDTSSGAMLFANDSDDITALVKKKLGM